MSEYEMYILAERAWGDSFLIAVGGGYGYALSFEPRERSPIMQVDAILKYGYWYEYQGSSTVADLLGAWRLAE